MTSRVVNDRVASEGFWLQAWYREGQAAKALGRLEDATQAFFEAYSLDPTNKELSQAFQSTLALAREDYAKSLGAAR